MKTSSTDGVPERKRQDGQRDVTAFQGGEPAWSEDEWAVTLICLITRLS